MPVNWEIMTMRSSKTYHHMTACFGEEAQLGICRGDASQRPFQPPPSGIRIAADACVLDRACIRNALCGGVLTGPDSQSHRAGRRRSNTEASKSCRDSSKLNACSILVAAEGEGRHVPHDFYSASLPIAVPSSSLVALSTGEVGSLPEMHHSESNTESKSGTNWEAYNIA